VALIGAAVAGAVGGLAVLGHVAARPVPGADALLPLAGTLAVVVTPLLGLAVRRLATTPNERILEASKTAGTLLDSAYGVEPSFVTEMVERRYWARRKLRSHRLGARVPVLVAQDLLLLRRRPRRLLWVAAAATLPALLAHAPGWILGVAVLAGGLIAGGVTAGTTRTDAGNPVLLRLLGLSSRQVIGQRLWVPGVLCGLWYTACLALLHGLGDLPAGPWWALGPALGPVGAAATMRRARVGFVDNALVPLDTPMGSVSTGPLLNAVAGLDVLLLGLPSLVQIAQGGPLGWTAVAVQGAVAVIGLRAYLNATTKADRVELGGR
jgi:hypothetical protein